MTFLISGSGISDHAASIMSASTDYLPLYNGDWWNVTLQTFVTSSTSAGTDNTTANQKWILDCRSAKDHGGGRITHSGSATLENHSGSYSASFNKTWRNFGSNTYWNYGGFSATSNATRYLDTGVRGDSGTVKQFSGSFQEIRLWTTDEVLEDRVLDIHTLSPRTVVGNSFSASYDHLVARYPLGTQFKKSNLSGSVITSTHPQSTLTWTSQPTALTASDFAMGNTGSDGTHFDAFTEMYYTTIPSYPSNGPSSVKVRTEDNTLIGQLNHNNRVEVSEYDRHPKDTNTVGVHLSLQHQINRDIAYQFGDLRVDDFIGDPEHQYLPDYPDLEQLRNFYFKKLSDKPDIGDFAKLVSYYDVSMFEMIKQMIPARGNSYVGLLVEPHILERNKIQRLPDMEQGEAHYRTTLDVKTDTFPLSMSSEFVSENTASLLTVGGENWWKLKSETANSSSFGELSDRAGLGEVGGFTASYEGTRYQWTQHYRNKNADGTFTTGSYLHTSDPLNTVVTGSRLSEVWETRVYKYSSSFSASWDTDRGMMAGGLGYGLSEPKAKMWNQTYKLVENGQTNRQRGKAHIYPNIGAVPRTAAERQDTEFTGFFNARYGGSKLTGNNYNQDSPSTLDGGPVIELFDSNPNQLIVTSPSVFGGSLKVPGITKNPGKGSKFLDKFGNPVSPLNPKSPAVLNQQVASNLSETVQTSMGGGKSYA